MIKDINAICRSFLWYGDSYNTKPGNIKWFNMCRLNSEGGRGVRNLAMWNEADIGKVAYHIQSVHESLWVK